MWDETTGSDWVRSGKEPGMSRPGFGGEEMWDEVVEARDMAEDVNHAGERLLVELLLLPIMVGLLVVGLAGIIARIINGEV